MIKIPSLNSYKQKEWISLVFYLFTLKRIGKLRLICVNVNPKITPSISIEVLLVVLTVSI